MANPQVAAGSPHQRVCPTYNSGFRPYLKGIGFNTGEEQGVFDAEIWRSPIACI